MGVAAVSHDSVSCSRDYPLGVAAVRPRRTVFDPEHVHRETTGRFRAVVSTDRRDCRPANVLAGGDLGALALTSVEPVITVTYNVVSTLMRNF